jgi:hypothetical protein
VIFSVLPQRPKRPLLLAKFQFDFPIEFRRQVFVPIRHRVGSRAAQFRYTDQAPLHFGDQNLLLWTG